MTHLRLGPRRWIPRPSERRVLLALGDLLAAGVAWLAALLTWYWSALPYSAWRGWWGFAISRPAWFYALPFLWLLLLVDLYDDSRALSARRTTQGVLFSALLGLLLYLLFYFVLTVERRVLPRISVAAFVVYAPVATLLWRALYRRIATRWVRRVLIVGAGRHGREFVTYLRGPEGQAQHPAVLVGFVDDDPAKQGQTIAGLPVLGTGTDLPALITRHAVTDVVVAIVGEIRGELFQALLDAQAMGAEVSHLHGLYEEAFQRLPIRHLAATWLIQSFMDQARKSIYYQLGKRALDVVAALVGLALLAVMGPFIALIIVVESGWPVLFAQKRVGRHGHIFTVYKFRTMRPAAETTTNRWATDDELRRVTRFGKFLRKTHLDEFPQFLNVLWGQMSVVGPRPEQPKLVQELERQIPFYRARLLVKPGITGWAQINHGYAATLEGTVRKLEYDLYYIKHRNLAMDVLIILRTVAAVLGFRGH